MFDIEHIIRVYKRKEQVRNLLHVTDTKPSQQKVSHRKDTTMIKPVTQEQIDAVTRFVDESTNTVFYVAQSATTP